MQGFFLALILLTKKDRNRKPDRIMASLLIILSLSIVHSVFVIDTIGGPYRIKEPFILLIGPLLLFYVRSFSEREKPNSKADFLHFIPFLLFFLIILPVTVHGTKTLYAAFLYKSPVLMGLGIWILIVLQYGFYWIKIINILNSHKSAVESEFSDTGGKSLSWLGMFAHIFGVFFLILTLSIAVALHSDNYFLVDRIVSLALSCTIFVLGYAGFFQQDIFTGSVTNSPAVPTSNAAGLLEESIPVEVYEPEKDLKKGSDNELIARLMRCLEQEKSYLNEKLTLTDLAGQLKMTRNQLSSVINNDLGSSFYTLINKYRVEEVKRLLADPKNKNLTILALAYEAGFPAKSSFHSIFKKFTGLTPTEYRNRLENNDI